MQTLFYTLFFINILFLYLFDNSFHDNKISDLMYQAAAKYLYSTLRNSSTTISNMIGPVEQMAVANVPIKGFYFMVAGSPEVFISVTNIFFSSNLLFFYFYSIFKIYNIYFFNIFQNIKINVYFNHFKKYQSI